MFTHLHNHTTYSILDGLPKIKELVLRAKELGMTSLAITDSANMYGVIEFYQSCKKNGIKPIIGEEFFITEDISIKKPNTPTYHLILLAKNLEGYKNLIKLTSLAHLDGMYDKPRIDFNLLKQYKEGLICTTACQDSQFGQLIINKELDKLDTLIKQYIELFGKENFFFEIIDFDNGRNKNQALINETLLNLSTKYEITPIATCDSHYLRKEDSVIQDIVLCIHSKTLVSEKNRVNLTSYDLSLRSEQEMLEVNIFKNNPHLVENTQKVVELCNLELEMGVTKLPYYQLEDGITAEQEMRNIARRFCPKKYGVQFEDLEENTKNRFEYEVSVIKRMGYESYFLIVQDFINWAKSNGIAVGPGRGSGAGSIIAYLLNITDIDPIKYNLLFERFLNPDRISMPDFDVDFSDARRDEVIKYTEKKYGNDHVAHIITFGTMASRASVKDIGRVLGVPYGLCDKMAKSIPQGSEIEDALKESPEFKEMYDTNTEIQRIVDAAKKIEGGIRNTSVHACGILITKDPLNETSPVQLDDKTGTLISQYSGHPAEDLGLLKMDFLGLKNLTILEKACEIVQKVHGVKIDLNNLRPPDGNIGDGIHKFTKEEEKAFKLLQNGDTTGVFQLESSGMKKYLKDLKPTGFEDIIAMVALYRPGPMQFIPSFIARKHGEEEIKYDHPLMKEALQNTYGITVYQEQVMQLSKDMSGFTGGDADGLRKAIGKKIASLMAEYKGKFIEGGVKNQIPQESLEKIWKEWEKFAEYCFNRSHAACYAAIAYQTAYIKANFTECFMAALLISDSDDIERIAIEIKDTRHSGIQVLSPDINESLKDFTVVKDSDGNYAIRFGLSAIKNVGENIVAQVIEERQKNGPFKDIEDLLIRIDTKDLNKKSLEAFIKAGVFDKINDRNTLLTNTDMLLNYSKGIKEEKNTKQVNIFGILSDDGSSLPKLKLEKTEDIDLKTKLSWEKEMLGLYISSHPMKDYDKYLDGKTNSVRDLKKSSRKKIIIAGVINDVKKISTKNNELMAFVNIEDSSGATVEVVFFPRVYKEKGTILEKDKIVIVIGNPSDKDGEPKILANDLYELNEINVKEVIEKIESEITEKELYKKPHLIIAGGKKPFMTDQPQGEKSINIKLKDGISPETIKKLKIFLQENNGGEYKVFFVVKHEDMDNYIPTSFKISLNDDIKAKIKEILN